MPKQKRCEYCGKGFKARHKARKYCSEECRRKADKKHKRDIYALTHPDLCNDSGEKYCKNCGELFIAVKPKRGATSKFCSKACAHRYDVKHHPRQIPSVRMIDPDITLNDLFLRDQGVCYICGKLCNFEDYHINAGRKIAGNTYPSIDHIIPISKGGEHSWTNVKLAHRLCNSMKQGN